jgi:hypothetical protein
MFYARPLGTCSIHARKIVLEPKFIDLDEPAPVLVMPAQAHPLRKPVGVPYWRLCDWYCLSGHERATIYVESQERSLAHGTAPRAHFVQAADRAAQQRQAVG